MLLALLVAHPAAGADMGNGSVYSQTDASNNSGTVPTWAEGMAPSQVNDSARALQGALKRWYDHAGPTVTSGGSANTQTLTYGVAPAAYVAGDTFAFLAGFTNTGAATVNVNALGAKNVFNANAALGGGEIVAGHVYVIAYDGTQFQLVSPAFGKQTISIPAGAWLARTTSGAVSSQAESTTNKVNRKLLGYVDASATYAQALVIMPKSWNLGTLTYRVSYEDTVANNAVVWQLQALCLRDGDTIDTAFGTAVAITDTVQSAATITNITSESGAVTPAGTCAAAAQLYLQLYRDGGAGGDTNTGQANLVGVQVFYATTTGNDQ